MYKRARWWTERSKTPEYQAAYDNIAEAFPSLAKSAVDIGCGTGEVLRRIHGKAGKVYGTDASREMLLLAQENLGMHGIDSRVYSSPLSRAEYEAESIWERAALIVDNILHTQLPANYFDVSLLTFPDIAERKPTEEMVNMVEVFHRQFPQLPLVSLRNNVVLMHAHKASVKIVKEGGVFIGAFYFMKQDFDSHVDAVFDAIGLEPLQKVFCKDKKINDDTEESFPGAGGYAILAGKRR